MFHAGLLKPYKETRIHGPNYTRPPPDLVKGEQEYEVEAILNERRHHGRPQYLVKWKGYSDAENTWEVQDNARNATDLVRLFHQRHPQAPALAPRRPRGRRSGGG